MCGEFDNFEPTGHGRLLSSGYVIGKNIVRLDHEKGSLYGKIFNYRKVVYIKLKINW